MTGMRYAVLLSVEVELSTPKYSQHGGFEVIVMLFVRSVLHAETIIVYSLK